MTFEHALHPERNSFGPMRLALALAVVVSHSTYLTVGQSSAEPFFAATGMTLGQHAVEAFFVISGVLISVSISRTPSLGRFILQRASRLLPALFVCVMITTLLIGPIVTAGSLRDYFGSSEPYLYVVRTATMLTGNAALPGVFNTLPVAGDVNIPLYTLKYEVFCYALLGLTALVGLFGNRRFMTVAAAIILAGNVILQSQQIPGHIGTDSLMPRFVLCFALGVLAWQWRDQLHLRLIHVALALAIYGISLGTSAQWYFGPLATAAVILWLAAIPSGALQRFTVKSDLSYGIYVWGWITQQCVVWAIPGITAMPHLALSLLLLLPVAWLSWTYVERPALAWGKGTPDNDLVRAPGHLATPGPIPLFTGRSFLD